MAKPRKRAKPYRPRPVGGPITSTLVKELVTPAHLAVNVLTHSASQDGCRWARDHLGVFVYLLAVLHDQYEPNPYHDALQIFIDMDERYKRTGLYRFAGGERERALDMVVAGGHALGVFQIHQVMAGCERVERELGRGSPFVEKETINAFQTDAAAHAEADLRRERAPARLALERRRQPAPGRAHEKRSC